MECYINIAYAGVKKCVNAYIKVDI